MSLELIVGCMFSGKTTELIRRIRRAKVAGYTVQMFKYAGDNRYGRKELATSHDGTQENAKAITKGSEIHTSADVIGIDEGQFIQGLQEHCHYLLRQGKTIIISALHTNYKQEPFQEIHQIWFMADKLTQLHAICVICKGDACFSKRTLKSSQEEVIGGSESYQARCRKCWEA